MQLVSYKFRVEVERLVCDKVTLIGETPPRMLRCCGNIVDMLLMCKAEVQHTHSHTHTQKKTIQGARWCVLSNHISHSATYFSDDHQPHSLVNV